MARTPLTLRTRMQRLVRMAMCFAQSRQRHDIVMGLFVNRDVCGRTVSRGPLHLANTLVPWRHTHIMKHWTTCMTLIVGFFIAFSHCNAYVSPHTGEKFPFKILQDDENFYYQVTLLKKQEDVIIDTDDIADERYWETFMPDEGNFSSVNQNANKKSYVRATLESSVLLGLVSAFYWSKREAAADFHYDVSFHTLKKKLSGEAMLFDEDPIGANSFPGHPLAGSYYYLIARNQNLSRLMRPYELLVVDRFWDARREWHLHSPW
jgi:hypothetical protein